MTCRLILDLRSAFACLQSRMLINMTFMADLCLANGDLSMYPKKFSLNFNRLALHKFFLTLAPLLRISAKRSHELDSDEQTGHQSVVCCFQ